MEVLRLGSKGKEVERLQGILGVKPDSIFGQKTLEAVKKYQREHSLFPDGIVGPKTWEKLLADNSLQIGKAFIDKHITYSPNRQVKYIAIHYTAGSTSRAGAAMNTRKAFLSRPASADFVVDDAEIVQINPNIRNYYCWAVGDNKNPYTGGGRLNCQAMNKNTISIEICSSLKKGRSDIYPNHDGWYFTDEVLKNALKLVKYLMKMYNVPKNNVVRHYDITGKLCPGIVGWNDAFIYDDSGKSTGVKNNSEKWKEFWNKI